ncbi:MAG: LamG-like jellyroll fold domain-containing protein [Nonlabens sp.]
MKRYVIIVMLCVSMGSYAQIGTVPSFFRTQRDQPIIDLNTTATISVSNYGAIVNDGIDDIPGITAAINAAVTASTAQNPVRLLFDNGTYDIMPGGNNTHALEMNDAESVLWDGQNAEFLVHSTSHGFLSLLRCRNTIIKDITIDYATVPFTQGRVTNVDLSNGYFDFVVDNGFPLPTDPLFSTSPKRWGMLKNADGSLKEGAPNQIQHIRFFELIAPRTYRYHQNNAVLNSADVGDYFIHVARDNGKTLIRNNGGKNLTYLNVTGHASPAGGFNARNSEEWNVINCRIIFKPGRLHTLNADAMHVNGGKIAPWVENSTFEGFADDCMNLKYIKRVILSTNSPTEITVNGEVEVGETLEFYNPRDGIFLGVATATAVVNNGGNQYTLTLSDPININVLTSPDHQLADKAYIESRSNESLIFRNNIVRNSRRYGILIQSKYALIENNLFENLSQSGVRIENGVDWGEGFRAEEIEIRNNTFKNCGFDTEFISDPGAASITVDLMKLGTPCSENMTWCGTESTNWQGHENIRIIDNTIIYNKKGLHLKNINGLTLSNNFICHNGQDITLGPNDQPIDQLILNVSNSNVSDFNYQLPDADYQFLLSESSATAESQNTGTDNSFALSTITNGGIITKGFVDSEIGYAIRVNTTGNGALRLVDATTQIPLPGPVAGGARSYAFWVKPEQAIFQTLLYSGGPAQGEVFSIQMQANGVVRVTDNDQNTISMADMPLDIGQWNHITITVPEDISLSKISLFKNGVPSNETLSGDNALVNTASNVVDFFPRFTGVISDIRFFDYDLCVGDVERIYNNRQTTLSIQETLEPDSSKIKIFPTVVDEILSFDRPVQSFEIYSLAGKRLLSSNGEGQFKVDVSELSTGLYFIQINNIQTEKFTKK